MKRPYLITDEQYAHAKDLYLNKGFGIQIIKRITGIAEHPLIARFKADGIMRDRLAAIEAMKSREARNIKDLKL